MQIWLSNTNETDYIGNLKSHMIKVFPFC